MSVKKDRNLIPAMVLLRCFLVSNTKHNIKQIMIGINNAIIFAAKYNNNLLAARSFIRRYTLLAIIREILHLVVGMRIHIVSFVTALSTAVVRTGRNALEMADGM